jgi:hypothetical protein
MPDAVGARRPLILAFPLGPGRDKATPKDGWDMGGNVAGVLSDGRDKS